MILIWLLDDLQVLYTEESGQQCTSTSFTFYCAIIKSTFTSLACRSLPGIDNSYRPVESSDIDYSCRGCIYGFI